MSTMSRTVTYLSLETGNKEPHLLLSQTHASLIQNIKQHGQKISSRGRQEPQPAGTVKWPTTLRFGKILGATSVVRSIENPRDVLQRIHRP